MALDGRQGVDVYSVAGEDHPQSLPFRGPAFYILAAQVGFYDFGRARVLADKPLSGRSVDQERFVEAGQDATIRLDTGELGEGDAVVPIFSIRSSTALVSRLQAFLPKRFLGTV